MGERRNLKTEEIEQFVAQAQNGSSEAFGELYDIFINPIYRYIHYRVGPQEAEDLTELVFLKSWENIRQYRKGVHSFSAWLFRIAHNIIVDFYRSNHQQVELSEEIEDERLESNSIQRSHRHFDQEILAQAMRQLKDVYRQIIILRYINDFSYEEIVHIMGRSHAALRILQFRALRSLKKNLERMGITKNNM